MNLMFYFVKGLLEKQLFISKELTESSLQVFNGEKQKTPLQEQSHEFTKHLPRLLVGCLWSLKWNTQQSPDYMLG